jgi:hypothetical protein
MNTNVTPANSSEGDSKDRFFTHTLKPKKHNKYTNNCLSIIYDFEFLLKTGLFNQKTSVQYLRKQLSHRLLLKTL